MTKKTRNLETAAEIINKQEREITEEEENLTQDPKKINLEKEEEDKVHQAIIDMTTNQIKVEATPETEEVLEVKAETEEAPEVEVETGVDLTEVKVATFILGPAGDGPGMDGGFAPVFGLRPCSGALPLL